MANHNNKYQSYQSMVLPTGEDDNRDNSHLPLSGPVSVTASPLSTCASNNPHRKRQHVFLGCIAALGMLSLVTIAWRMNTMTLTPQEREIAWRNNLPETYATKRKIPEAQATADAGQQRLERGTNVATTAGFLFSIKGGSASKKSKKKQKKLKHEEKETESNSTPLVKSSPKDTKAPVGCEATVIIIRHCEKEDVREHCGYVGYERSVYLTTLFGDGDERWPSPSWIYALSPVGRHNRKKMNFREIETVGSLSEKVGVSVNFTYTASHTGRLADELLGKLHEGEMCGKVALVSWKHSNIHHLAARLGCGPVQGCPMDYKGKVFDEVWQIKFVYREFSHSTKKSLKLSKSPKWKVFGSVQNEGFDPLAFSKMVGDYPKGGNQGKKEPGWRPGAAEVQERKSLQDKNWAMDQASIEFLSFARSSE